MDNVIVTVSGWIIAVVLGVPAAYYYGRRILRERAAERQENKKRLKDILQLVRNSVAYAEQYNKHGTRIPVADLSRDWFAERPWLKKELQKSLSKLRDLAADFELWLRVSKDLVSATAFRAAYYDGTFSEFSGKMDKTGRGKFSDLLLNHLLDYILSGEGITIPWLRDNIPSLYEEMLKAGTEREIRDVVEPISQVAQNDCLQAMREKRQQFMEEARQTIRYLETLTR